MSPSVIGSSITQIPVIPVRSHGAVGSGQLVNLKVDTLIDHMGNLLVDLETQVLAGGRREEVVRASVGMEVPLESVWSYLLHALHLDLSKARLPFLRSLANHWSPPVRWVQEDNATFFTYYQRMCPHIKVHDDQTHVEWVMGEEWTQANREVES